MGSIIMLYCVMLVFVTLILPSCNSANILCIFPATAYSHQQPQLALSYALADRGHNLTVITTNPSQIPITNVREVDISFMYGIWEEMQSKIKFSLQKRLSPYEFLIGLPLLFEQLVTLILDSPQMQDFIVELKQGDTKYDLIIYEALFHSAFLGLADLVNNPPIIGIITMHVPSVIDHLLGNPTTSSYIPSLSLPYDNKMSFLERLNNLLMNIFFEYVMRVHNANTQEKLIEKYFGKLKYSAQEMEHNMSLLIVSSDLATGYPKAVQPNTIYVGPMHIKNDTVPLPQDIKSWMDEATEGVIYFSLGSNMKGTSVPEEIRTAFIKAFSQFPKIRVLWKWEAGTKLPAQPDNVLTKQWVPQQSILAHPNVKIFISQVGLQSTQEAINFQVPILGIPMFGDQEFNAAKIVNNGVGVTIEFSQITHEKITEKINEILSNNSYKENMRRLSAITKDKPMSPVDTAIWWVEYVIRHNGASHLRPTSLDLYWYKYYMIDIFAFLILLAVLFFFITYLLIKIVVLVFHLFYKIENIKIKTV